MGLSRFKLAGSVLVAAGLAVALVIQHQAQTRLRAENQSLRRQMAELQAETRRLSRRAAIPKLMPIQVATQTNEALPDELHSANVFSRYTNEVPKLTAAQVEAFLKANRTNGASLLAAYRTSGDPTLLKEAMEKYPDDPQVAFEAAVNKKLPPEDQRQWLDNFKTAAPDNALANYLSAGNYFDSGQIDQGIAELTAASGKRINDYTLERALNDQEAYLSAGYSPVEAECIADSSLLIPQDSMVKGLGVDLVSLAKTYQQAGDPASAQAAFQMAINLGQNYAALPNDPILINQLVGLAIQKIAFNAMDPNSPYGDTGQTAQDQMNQINQVRTSLRELANQATPWLPMMSDQDILSYENRRQAFGEVAALQWVVGKFGQP